MHNVVKYISLFVITLLVQIMFLDRLTLSVYFAPLIYTAVLFLLPVNAAAIVNLATALVAGVMMDLLTGTPGLNTLATLAVGYVRRPLLLMIVGRDGMRDGGIPSPAVMGRSQFLNYFFIVVVMHGAIFYMFEAFTVGHLVYTLLRFAVGTLSSLLLLLVAASMFTSNIPVRQ